MDYQSYAEIPPKRDYGRYFCSLARKEEPPHRGLMKKQAPFFHAQNQEVNVYAIAKAPDGVDQLVGEGLVHLVAQVSDIHIRDIGVVVKVEVPDVVGDLGPGQGLPLMA